MDIKEVLESIIKNDKTPAYEYADRCQTEKQRWQGLYDANGNTPEKGKRWQTPSELASTALITITQHKKEILEDFSDKDLQDELDRRDNERERDIQTRHDAEMAQAESDAMKQAEAEAGIEADRECAEAEAMAKAEAQNAEADAQASAEARFDAEMDEGEGGY